VKNNFFFIDHRGAISNDPNSLKRHERYVQNYKNKYDLNSNDDFTVLSNKEQNSIPSNKLKIEYLNSSIRFSPVFIYKCGAIIKNKGISNIILICPDPWESYFIAFIIKKIYAKKANIQVQLHADVLDPGWINLKITNKVKSLLVFFAMRNAANIRFVSEHQSKKLVKKFKIEKERYFISNVPCNYILMNKGERKTKNQPENYGFLGRINHERGLLELLELFMTLTKINPKAKLFVTGYGKDVDWFRNQILTMGIADKVVIQGFMNIQELSRFWARIDVLLSTSSSESFGRTIRESLYVGIPVLAKKSNGTESLKKVFNRAFFQVYEDHKNILEIKKLIKRLKINENTDSLKNELEIMDQNAVETLTKAWHKLTNMKEK
jgi:glycosyltransferase involved in cell wall biosynthesis